MPDLPTASAVRILSQQNGPVHVRSARQRRGPRPVRPRRDRAQGPRCARPPSNLAGAREQVLAFTGLRASAEPNAWVQRGPTLSYRYWVRPGSAARVASQPDHDLVPGLGRILVCRAASSGRGGSSCSGGVPSCKPPCGRPAADVGGQASEARWPVTDPPIPPTDVSWALSDSGGVGVPTGAKLTELKKAPSATAFDCR